MIVKPKSVEISLSTANTVSDATCVRIYNDSGVDVLVTNVESGFGFTLPDGAITFVQKASDENLAASGAVKATSVAFNIS